jgi:uncharacterized protein YgbK (DUF1537 family)
MARDTWKGNRLTATTRTLVTTLLLVADDLTGAADACAKFVAHGFSGTVLLQREDDDGRRASGSTTSHSGDSGGSSDFRDASASGSGAGGSGTSNGATSNRDGGAAASIATAGSVQAIEIAGPLDVLALNTDTRRVNEAEARRRVHAAGHLAHHRPAAAIFKKVDSTLRGHVGVELEAAMDAFGCTHAIVAPAFPSMGRIVRDGALIVEGMSGRPPRDVAALLAAQGVRGCVSIGIATAASGGNVDASDATAHGGNVSASDAAAARGSVNVATVTAASDSVSTSDAVAALRGSMARALAQGARVLVCDAVTHADLDAIVAAASALAADAAQSDPPMSDALASQTPQPTRPGRPLWVGSAGLAEALAASLAAATAAAAGHDPVTSSPPQIAARGGDRVVMFIGSTHAMTRAQQVHLLAARDVATVVGGHARGAAAAAGVHHALNRGRHVLITMDWSRIEPEALRHLIDAAHHPALGGFVMSGGDTAADVCAAMGAIAVRVGGEVANGVPWGVLCGGLADGVPIVFKSGGFGARETLLTAVDFLARLSGDRHAHT